VSGTTLLLILKSLFPLAREIILKDKDLRAFLLDNKLASILSGCLIFLFVLFLYISEVADSALKDLDRLKFVYEHQSRTVEELKERNAALEKDKQSLLEALNNREPPQSPTNHHQPPDAKPPRRTRSKLPDDVSIKFYIEQRLRSLEQDGK